MTPLERAASALYERFPHGQLIIDAEGRQALTGIPWESVGASSRQRFMDDARTVIAAIREPIADASVYLKADAEAWELGAKDAPHEVYLMESGRLRRSIAERLDALLAEGA